MARGYSLPSSGYADFLAAGLPSVAVLPAQSMTLLQSLRYRPFALLWSGQSVSRLGDSLYRVALAWWVLDKTHSATAMGTVLMFSLTPTVLFLLLGGVMVDRLPRLRVLMASDLFSGLIITSVALLAYADRLALWHVYVASLLFGFVEAFFFPAYNSVVPELIPTTALPSANSLTSLGRDVTGVAGPAIGAAVIALGGTPLAFALDGLSFFVAALCLLPLMGQLRSPAGSARTGGRATLQDLQVGLQTVAASPWLWISIAVFGLINITAASPASVTLPFLIKQNLHAGVEVLGLFTSLFAAGSVLAALGLGRLTRIPRRGLLAYVAVILNGLITVTFGLLPSVPLLGLAALLRGLSVTTFGLIWLNTLQELVPRDKLGRVSSIDALGSYALLPVGFWLVGRGTDLLGPPAVFLLGGTLTVLMAIAALAHPAIRKLD